MIIMTGLIIKDNGFLALPSIAAPIYVLHIRMCRKVPLLYAIGMTHKLYRLITPSHFWSLIIRKLLFMQVSISKCKFSISKVTTNSLTGVTNDAI